MVRARTALIRKRLRHRFGIRAPKVTVRTHVAWHVWLLGGVLLVLMAGMVGAWLRGMPWRGDPASWANAELVDTYRQRIVALENELLRSRKLADTGESQVQIERSASQQLVAQVKRLEQENASLREDLAFFEGLVPGSGGGGDGPKVSRLRIDPDGDGGNYRFRMLLVQQGGKSPFVGQWQMLVRAQVEGREQEFPVPQSPNESVRIELKNFLRLEGRLVLPAGSVIRSAEVRLLQNGATTFRQTIKL
jgi:hypothetical protein